MVLPGGALHDVQMWDLGSDGASITSSRPITQGSIIDLRFDLPVAGGPAHIEARAKVVYSSYMAAANFKVGLMFIGIDAAGAAAIHAFGGP